MHTKLIRLLLGLLCLCVSGLTFGQTGLQALQLSDMAYLDPLHQLSDAERRDIEDRLATMR